MCRHSNTLLKRIGEIRLMNRKAFFIIIFLGILLLYPVCSVNASTGEASTIQVLDNKYWGNGRYTFQVQCHIGEERLINDQLKFSYHIWNGDKTEYIAYENERIAISTNGQADTIVSFDIKLPKTKERAWICFDVVHEKSGFWFAGTDGINFSSEDIYYSYSFLDNFKTLLNVNMKDYSLLFGLNILTCVWFIFLAIYIKRKELL